MYVIVGVRETLRHVVDAAGRFIHFVEMIIVIFVRQTEPVVIAEQKTVFQVT